MVAFATLGHHLPGFLRAYGDRELFTRFRARFLLAPPLIFAFAWTFATLDLHGLALVVLLWGTWHGLMQTYGFMRIYDFKQGAPDRRGAQLDFALCLTLFATGIVLSDARVYGMAQIASQTGLGVPSHAALVAVRSLAVGLTAGVMLLYGLHLLSRRRRGAALAWPRVALAASTGWLYWLAGTLATDMLLGVAMFEIFHAVQYDAIVWAYNRSRAKKSRALWRPLAALFARERWSSLGIYAALIGGFGALRLLGEQAIDGRVQVLLLACVTTSTILHYYFDGFIWKVSERATQADLAIAERSETAPRKPATPRLSHATAGALFALLILGLLTWEYHRRGTTTHEQDTLARLAALTPDLPELQWRASEAALATGDVTRAVATARRGVELRPYSQQAYSRLGAAELEAGDWTAAAAAFRAARRIAPGLWQNHSNLAIALSRLKDWKQADESFTAAAGLKPETAALQAAWTQSCVWRGDRAGTIEHGRAALAADPRDSEVRGSVVEALLQTNEPEEARRLLDEGTALDPQAWRLLFLSGNLQTARQELAAAADSYRRVLDLQPQFAPALANLASVQWLQGDLPQARQAYERAVQLTPDDAAVHYNLGMLLRQIGDPSAAAEHLLRAEALGGEK